MKAKKRKPFILVVAFAFALAVALACALAACGNDAGSATGMGTGGASSQGGAGAGGAPATDADGETASQPADAPGGIVVVGAGDSKDATVDVQDGAYYFDFGSVTRDGLATGYPMAFTVNGADGKPLASWTVSVDTGADAASDPDAFSFEPSSEFTEADGTKVQVFTVLYASGAKDGPNSLVLKISGKDASGADVSGIFVATLNVVS